MKQLLGIPLLRRQFIIVPETGTPQRFVGAVTGFERLDEDTLQITITPDPENVSPWW